MSTKLFQYMLPKIVDYESGNMTEEKDVLMLFQELVDSGLAWTLQGHYGRIAQKFIDDGMITPSEPDSIFVVPEESLLTVGYIKKAEELELKDTPEKEAQLKEVLKKLYSGEF